MSKRIISILLSILLCLGTFNMQAFAAMENVDASEDIQAVAEEKIEAVTEDNTSDIQEDIEKTEDRATSDIQEENKDTEISQPERVNDEKADIENAEKDKKPESGIEGELLRVASEATDFTYESGPNDEIRITGYVGSDTTVIIPVSINNKYVTSIANEAFANNVDIVSVIIPSRVNYIGGGVFSNCVSLKEIVIPDDVTYIGDGALEGCINLKSLTAPFICGEKEVYYTDSNGNRIPMGSMMKSMDKLFGCVSPMDYDKYDALESVSITNTGSLPDNAFSGWKSIKTISLSDTITRIGNSAFYNCNALTDFTIPDNVTYIGDKAFDSCWGLDTLIIPDGMEHIGAEAFAYCKGISVLTIPDSVISIGDGALTGCTGITYLTTPFICGDLYINHNNPITGETEKMPGVMKNMRALFGWSMPGDNDKYEALQTVCLTNVDRIIDSAFADCNYLKNIYVPNDINTIGTNAFNGCMKLESFTIPSSVTYIGDGAFMNCSSLTSMTIPDGVTYIGEKALSGCNALTELTTPFICGTLWTVYPGVDGSNNRMPGVTTNMKTLFGIEFPEVEDRYSSLKKVTLTNVENLCDNAFSGWKNIEEINLPSTLKYIGMSSFANCTGLKSIYLPDGVVNIGPRAFDGCSGFTEFIIPNSVEIIGDGALANCSKITSLYIPDSVTDIGTGALQGCTGLTELTTPFICGQSVIKTHNPDGSSASVPGIMYDMRRLLDITLPGDESKYSSLRKVTLTDITRIPDNAFSGFEYIEEINLPENVKAIGAYAFSYCSGLKKIVIPENVTVINNNAFYECNGLEEIELPLGLTSISDYAFFGCTGIKNMYVPKSVNTIGEYAIGMTIDNSGVVPGINYVPIEGFSIFGEIPSAAYSYALENNIPFVTDYLIRYILGDGAENNPENPVSYDSTSTIELKPATRVGYIFDGWYDNEFYIGSPVTHINKGETGLKTLYAKWTHLFTLTGYKLTLNGNCDLEYVIKMTDKVADKEKVVVDFELNGRAPVRTYPARIYGDYVTFICEVPAKQLTDNIVATMFIGDDGYYLGNYSVKDYLDVIIENRDNLDDYAMAHDLAVALLNYGASAQEYFGYNTDKLANANLLGLASELPSDEKIMDTICCTVDGTDSNSDFEFYGASLVCKSDTYLKLYFKNKNNLSLDNILQKYRCYVTGGSDPRGDLKLVDNMLIMTLDDIPAAELDNVYTFYIKNYTNKADSIALEYSPMDYVLKAMKTDDTLLKNLCKCLRLYNEAADAYYGRYTLTR